MGAPLVDLELAAVGKTYTGTVPVLALRATSLLIRSGSHIAITGSSGSGKSTLLNVLGLLDTPTFGQYLINGIDVAGVKETVRSAIRSQLFGFVFQSFHLQPSKTAFENVNLGLLYGSIPASERKELAMDALRSVGLMHRQHARPSALSGGERQRVAIARAIVHRPAVLFCDEPTGNLDSINTDIVLALLDSLNSDGMTLVIVTHEESVAARAQSGIVVVDGTILSSTGS